MPPSDDTLPILRGPRVTLRPPREGEHPALAALIAADPQTGPRWSTDAETLMRWFTEDGMELLVAEVDGRIAGVLDFEEARDPEYRSAGMDIGMLSGFTDRGLGTEALRLLATYLIDERGHHRLTIDPAADNARAIRAYEKLGFKPIGVARKYERLDDGEWHDGLLMDLLAEEFVRLQD